MLFSEMIKNHDEDTRRRLYALFTRAAKQGAIPALKLLDKMTVTGKNGEARQVQDFAIPNTSEKALRDWIDQNVKSNAGGKNGVTAEQVATMTDEELTALIQRQNAPRKKRQRKAKTTPEK